MKFLKYFFLVFIPFFLQGQCGPPLRIAFMTHLEDEWQDAVNPQAFINHKNSVLLEISFFKPYGAKVNFESAPPFLNGCYNLNDNAFQMLIDSSMGVGGHNNSSALYDSTYSLIRGLIGNNQQFLGTSGGVGPNDTLNSNNWVDSALAAGYNYVNGITYVAWLQIPRAERPNQEDDTLISKYLWHDPLFPDLRKNIFPRRIQSAFSFHKDSTGQLVLISGSVGTLPKLAEGYSACINAFCPLDSADIDTFLAKVNLAIDIARNNPDKIACIYTHVPLNHIKPDTKKFFDYLFDSLKPLESTGLIKYTTMEEIYKDFLNCEKTQNLKNVAPELVLRKNGDFLFLQTSLLVREMELYNIYGQSIRKTSSGKISVAELPTGIYILKALVNEKSHYRKIILR